MSEKYREFYASINSLNQLLTHIELNIIEMKGNISLAVVDVVSLLRRRRELPKLPKSVIEYLKQQIKLKRYRVDKKEHRYSFRPKNLIFEYLMRELKLSSLIQNLELPKSGLQVPMSLQLIGPKSQKFGCHKVDPLL